MSKRKDSQTAEKTTVQFLSGRRKFILYLSAAILVLIAVLLTFSIVSYRENRQLKASLTETEAKLQLREDAAAALEAQQSEQKNTIQKLQDEIQDLLNVEEPEPVITSDQLEEQLSSIRELVTKRYTYTNAARREANKTWGPGWDMPFSETSLLVTYDGVIKAGIDLGKIQIDVDEENRAITITLPPSEITDNYIPQDTINVLEAKDNLFNKVTFEDYNQFISDERPIMQDKAISMGLLTDADNEARAIIKAFLSLIPGMDSYKLTVN